ELAQYEEMQAFAQFGSDLDDATKATIDHGEKVREVLKQAQYTPRDVTTQVITLFALKHGFTKTIPASKIKDFMDGVVEHIQMTHPEYIEEIREKKILSDALIKNMKETMKAYVGQFERLQKAG
ncbi:MAG: F0F1 ATP synthase subunit alpha, partial [bacterium]